MSAVAMNSAVWPGTRIMAPAVAGIIIAAFGTATAFYVSGVGSLVIAVVVYFLPVPHVAGRSRASTCQDLKEGLNFVAKRSVFSADCPHLFQQLLWHGLHSSHAHLRR